MNEYSIVEKPYRIQLIESDIPIEFKTKAIKKIKILTISKLGKNVRRIVIIGKLNNKHYLFSKQSFLLI